MVTIREAISVMQPTQASFSMGSRRVLTLSLILLGIALIPLTLVRIPPLVDYPNHMARRQILSDAGHSEHLKAILRNSLGHPA